MVEAQVSRSGLYGSRRRGQCSSPTRRRRHRQMAGIEEATIRHFVQPHEDGVQGLCRGSANQIVNEQCIV